MEARAARQKAKQLKERIDYTLGAPVGGVCGLLYFDLGDLHHPSTIPPHQAATAHESLVMGVFHTKGPPSPAELYLWTCPVIVWVLGMSPPGLATPGGKNGAAFLPLGVP